jgi:hypothetical protein
VFTLDFAHFANGEGLTISTHGQGELVSGSVKVVSDGPIGGFLRFDLPGIGPPIWCS